MDTTRKVGMLAGVLFIFATVCGMISLTLLGPLQHPDYLTLIPEYENQVIFGALMVLLMGTAVVCIPVVLFPVFKQFNETLALGYVVFRSLEMVTYIAVVLSMLMIVTLSQEYVISDSPRNCYFQTLGAILQQADDWISLSMTLVFSAGAFMLYSLLYLSKLMPRWLSLWGLVGAVLCLAGGLLVVVGLKPNSTLQVVMELPIALNEMVLALWLIVKGFNAAAFSEAVPS